MPRALVNAFELCKDMWAFVRRWRNCKDYCDTTWSHALDMEGCGSWTLIHQSRYRCASASTRSHSAVLDGVFTSSYCCLLCGGIEANVKRVLSHGTYFAIDQCESYATSNPSNYGNVLIQQTIHHQKPFTVLRTQLIARGTIS
jgi:hypothetical protein